MSDHVSNAERLVANELVVFSKSIDEHWRDQFFHPTNQDEWVRRFCEWFAEKQQKSAEVRASND